MTSVFIRIALRWLAGAFVAAGYLSADMSDIFSDPELIAGLEIGIGVALGAVAEGWYYLARRFRWST